jgi:hypothetical protein
MKYLHLTLEEPPKWRNPMHTFLMEHEEMHLAQLLNWNTSDPELDVILFRIVGGVEPYTDALDQSPFVEGYETTWIDDDSFYAYIEHETREADQRFREAFIEQRVLTIPPIEYTEDGKTKVELVGRDEDVQAVIDDIPGEIDVRIDQIGVYDRDLAVFSSALTDRQQEALLAAIDVGYYEVPREGSIEDVAEELDCAASTASNHLRKAESTLVREVVGG